MLGNAGASIKNIDFALFTGEDDGGNDARFGWKVDQGRLRAQVIVPDVHMDGLETPDLAAGLGIERDERSRMLVLGLRSVRTPIVCRSVAKGKINKTQRLVTACRRPHVGRSASISFALGR